MDSIKKEIKEIKERLYGGWTPSYEDAIAIQAKLKDKVVDKSTFGDLKTLAGADIAILKDENKLIAGIVVFSYPALEVIEKSSAVAEESFPYIPGLLAFREAPAIIEAYRKLDVKPDLLVLDGQGIAHPRGFGIACHVGVILDVPSIGVAKKRLYGRYEDPEQNAGDWSYLLSNDGGRIGAVLRTKRGTKPVFISVGHKVDIITSLEIIVRCARGYRIPEPTRLADRYVAELKKKRNAAVE